MDQRPEMAAWQPPPPESRPWLYIAAVVLVVVALFLAGVIL